MSSCFGYAKGVHTRPDAVHVCYCYTPMRWVWRHDDYMARERFGRAQRLAVSARAAVAASAGTCARRGARTTSSPPRAWSPIGSSAATAAAPWSFRRRSTWPGSGSPAPPATST